MICPNCSWDVNIANRFGVEIDCCPICKGAIFDRGELEEAVNIQDRYEGDHYKRHHFSKDHEDDNDEDGYYEIRKQ